MNQPAASRSFNTLLYRRDPSMSSLRSAAATCVLLFLVAVPHAYAQTATAEKPKPAEAKQWHGEVSTVLKRGERTATRQLGALDRAFPPPR